MAKRLPPLNPLRTFEVAARCRSFTEAGKELNVTQAAISRQIAVLEGYFRTSLFERDVRTIRLTAVGRQLYEDITRAFDDIQQATERVFNEHGLIRVRTYPTLAAKWLVPIVGEFMSNFPAVDLRIETGVRPADFKKNDADIIIQFGSGDWPEVRTHRLIHDELIPVCSPEVAEGEEFDMPDALDRYTLLNSKFRNKDWNDWLGHVGARPLSSHKTLTFESSLLTYQAAVDGLGFAMGQKMLVQHDIEKGLLVAPFKSTLRRNLHYWITWSTRRRLSKEGRNFVDWLISRGEAA